MMRILGLLSGAALLGALSFSPPALAQAGGDVMEDADEGREEGASDEERDDSGDDDGDDGGWSSDGSSGESGVHFGLRLAYGIPMGDVTKASSTTSSSGAGTTTTTTTRGKLSDVTKGQIPIWLDLGWQFTPSFMLGAYFSYGFAILSSDVKDICDQSNASCSISDIRLGLQAQLSFSPGKSADPWIGAGVGYEWLTLKQEDTTLRFHGWELPMIQGGVDFGGDSGGSTVGPFVAFSMGRYTRARYKSGSIDESGDVDEPASHSWLFLGFRGVVK